MARENQKKRSQQLKEEILDTALSIAKEEGFDALSIRKISSRMGYSTGIIYYHYQDKQDIIEAIQAREGTYLRGLVTAAIKPDAGVVENLYAAFHSVMMLAITQRERYNLVVLQRHRVGEPERPGMVQMLATMLGQAVAEGKADIADVDRTAYAIWASFLGFHLMLSQRPDLDMDEADRMFDVQFRMIMKGIGMAVPEKR